MNLSICTRTYIWYSNIHILGLWGSSIQITKHESRITKYAYFGYTYKVIVICYINSEPQFIRCDKDFYSMKWWSKTYGPIFTSYLCSILLKTQKYREKLPANCARKPPIIPSIAVQGEKIIRAPMTREVKYTQLKSVHSYIEHQPWRPFLTTW